MRASCKNAAEHLSQMQSWINRKWFALSQEPSARHRSVCALAEKRGQAVTSMWLTMERRLCFLHAQQRTVSRLKNNWVCSTLSGTFLGIGICTFLCTHLGNTHIFAKKLIVKNSNLKNQNMWKKSCYVACKNTQSKLQLFVMHRISDEVKICTSNGNRVQS